jgi:hypothetical protein
MRACWWLLVVGCSSSSSQVPDSGPPPVDAICQPTAEICGDGIDQDCDGIDPPCPTNDRPSGAIDVSAGGLFDADLTFAQADDSPPADCGVKTRDLYYQLTLPAAETVYFDTFEGGVATELRVYQSSCTTVATATVHGCGTDACGTMAGQFAAVLAPGTLCIVVASRSADAAPGKAKLRVIRGDGRTGSELRTGISNGSGTTCGGPARDTASCVAGSATASDAEHFALICPGGATIDASTCDPNTDFDSNVYVIQGGGSELACNDTPATCASNPNAGEVDNVAVSGPGIAWVIVDGTGTGCGDYNLRTNIH